MAGRTSVHRLRLVRLVVEEVEVGCLLVQCGVGDGDADHGAGEFAVFAVFVGEGGGVEVRADSGPGFAIVAPREPGAAPTCCASGPWSRHGRITPRKDIDQMAQPWNTSGCFGSPGISSSNPSSPRNSRQKSSGWPYGAASRPCACRLALASNTSSSRSPSK